MISDGLLKALGLLAKPSSRWLLRSQSEAGLHKRDPVKFNRRHAEFFLRNYGVRTQATLIDIPVYIMGERTQPEVRFKTLDGEERRQELLCDLETFEDVISLKGHGLSEGDVIEIEYLPIDPGYVRRVGSAWLVWIVGAYL